MRFRYQRTTAVNLSLRRVCALAALRWRLLLTLRTEAVQVTSAGYQRLFPASLLLSDSVDAVATASVRLIHQLEERFRGSRRTPGVSESGGTILISLFDVKRGAKFSLRAKRKIGRT